jgi:arylsulfatase A-like enzyme
LKELGIDDNTLVIFTSDNGSTGRLGGSNAPLRGEKGTTWEGGMREPCIMRWPSVIPANTICNEVVTAMDFLPTFANLAGASVPDDRVIDGHDIGHLMFRAEGAVTPYEAFFYYGTREHKLEAVRAGKWKLHLITNELYDLESDVREEHNVFNRHPDVVGRLEALAQECRQELGDAHTGVEGANTRPVGLVDDPKPLTNLDEMSPEVRALYDLDDTVGTDHPR